MTSKRIQVSRVRCTKEDLDKLSKEELVRSWLLQENYMDTLEMKPTESSEHSELVSLRESEEKLKQQQLEATRRENILVMRLTTKEQEMQEYASQIQELKQGQIPSIPQLRSALLDPAVNLIFERMRKEMDSIKSRLEETQNELSTWKFTPDSNTGKRLLAKCRLLHQENEELGKIISSGKMAKLEGDFAMQKSFVKEMKENESDLVELVDELEENIRGMTHTVCYLKQQLCESKQQIQKLEQDKQKLSSHLDRFPTNHRLVAEENTDTEGETLLSPDPFVQSKIENRSFQTQTSGMLNDVNRIENSTSLPLNRSTNSGTPWFPPVNHYDGQTENFNKATSDQKVPADDSRDLRPPDLIDEDSHLSTGPSNSHCILGSSEVTCSKDVVDSLLEETANASVTQVSLQVDSETGSPDNIFVSEKNDEFESLCIDPIDKEMPSEIDNVEKSFVSLNIKTVMNITERSNENGKNKKRTRIHTPIEHDLSDDCLECPNLKRAKKKETTESEKKQEKQRASLEINTDTEVQVAQTLALWATAKQDRTDSSINSQDTTDSVDNGELKKLSEEKE